MREPKYNPFQPTSTVSTGMFVGRIDELEIIAQSLFQVRYENTVHFLLQGERGIGKSSLLYRAEEIARGSINVAEGVKLNMLTVSADVAGAKSQFEIVGIIANKLREAIDDRGLLAQKIAKFLTFIKRLEIAGNRIHEKPSDDFRDARDELVDSFVEIVSSLKGEIDGVLLLIDEADTPVEEAGLGEFLKLFTERLSRRKCKSILLGLAGLPSTVDRLRASHASSPRIFEIIRLQPLTADESREVVRLCLEDALAKTGVKTAIAPDALELIVNLSEGYPHFIQQFGYSAFAEDDDGVISVEDVNSGAYKENGALAQLGDKYFSEMYHARLSAMSDRLVMQAILREIALADGKWVARDAVARQVGISIADARAAMKTLEEENLIVVDAHHEGFYRLPTRSFATWINIQAKNASSTLSELPESIEAELRVLTEAVMARESAGETGETLITSLRSDEFTLMRAGADRYGCSVSVFTAAWIELIGRHGWLDDLPE